MNIQDWLTVATRAHLAEASRLLQKWDRNHRNAARVAAQMQSEGVRFVNPPLATMCSEYMPGRRALLEAADPADPKAVRAYIDAAFQPLPEGST